MRRRSGGGFLVLLCCVLAMPTVACIMGRLEWTADKASFAPYLTSGAILGLAHLILRPLLRLITLPLGCLTLGLSGTLIDIALIYLSAGLVRDFAVPSLLYAALTALLINVVSALIK